MSILHEKYADALVLSAKKAGVLAKVRENFRSFISAVKENKDLSMVLYSPAITGERETALLGRLFAKDFEPLFMRFLSVVAANRREKELPGIYDMFIDAADRAEGILKVIVSTSIELSGAQEKMIAEKISKKTGKKVFLEKIIDKGLVGGGVMRIGDRVLDCSVKNSLEMMRKELATC